MKKLLCSAALLLCAAILLSCCGVCLAEESGRASETAFSVNGKVFTREEYLSRVSLRAYDMGYSAYMTVGVDTNLTASQAAYDVAYEMITDELFSRKLAEMGLDTLTEEEETAARSQGSTDFSQISMYATYYYQVPVSVLAYLYTGKDLATEDDFIAESVRSTKINRMWETLTRDVALDENDEPLIASTLQSLIAGQQQQYATGAAFASAYNSGSISDVYWAPEGVRYVKQVLLQFSEEEKAAISDAKSALSAAEENKAEAQAALDAVLESAFARLRPLADEIVSRARAGEDFDQLMAQYGEDPGMTQEPFSVTGYAVAEGYTDFDPIFLNAAMALEKPGDVAEPAASDLYGFYIIRYAGDQPAGERALEDVRPAVEAEALRAKKNGILSDYVTEWLSEADIRLGVGFFFN